MEEDRRTHDRRDSATREQTAVELTEKFIDNVDKRLKILEVNMWWRWLTTIVGLAICIVVIFIAANNANNAAHRANKAVASIGSIVTETHNLATNIQSERFKSTYDTCQDQNTKHNNTIKRLRIITEQAVKQHKIAPGQVKKEIGQTIFLIDAFEPYSNCLKKASKTAPLPPSVTVKQALKN